MALAREDVTTMRDRFLTAWRTACQAGFTLLLAWLVGKGIHLDPTLTGIVELAVIAAGVGVWAAMVHWLQSQTGADWRGRLLRFLGRILVLGSIALPTYDTAPRR